MMTWEYSAVPQGKGKNTNENMYCMHRRGIMRLAGIVVLLCLLAVPALSSAADLIFTIQTGSFPGEGDAGMHYALLLEKLNKDDRPFLRIEKIGDYYTVRVGSFVSRGEAEGTLQNVQLSFPSATLMSAYVKDERIVRTEGDSLQSALTDNGEDGGIDADVEPSDVQVATEGVPEIEPPDDEMTTGDLQEETKGWRDSEDYLKGKKLYTGFCSPCHGEKGDGKGLAYTFTRPKARDFTSGIFKFRTSPPGQPPTDEDLIRVIRRGNPGTAMPAYGDKISDLDVLLIIDYVKNEFASEFFNTVPEPINIGDPPEADAEIVALGKKLYAQGECARCHGAHGRGDGVVEQGIEMNDAWGEPIYPANLEHPWELRNFSSVRDLYRTLVTGLDGTPMESYASIYSEDELWALAHYLKSIQIQRVSKNPLTIRKIEKVPSSPNDPLWDDVEHTDLVIGGKRLFGEALIPRVTNARLKGVHSGSEVALLIEWSDRTPNKGEGQRPPDSLSLTFQSKVIDTNPWIDKGDRRTVYDVWQWKGGSERAVEAVRRGSVVKKKKGTRVKVLTSYRDGVYRVLFVREKKAAAPEDIAFNHGEEVFYTLMVNDGDNFERGDRGGISGQRRLVLQ
jgi:mono/diheme cytochrome c family protein